MISTIVFYLFATVLTLSALAVITARNPVHAVLFLVLAFFNAAGMFLQLGAEFVAFILIIVYVGAVAVLFLFVVMMLDIHFKTMRQGLRRYLPLALVVGGVLLGELVFVANAWVIDPSVIAAGDAAGTVTGENTKAIGKLLYTDYILPFQMSGMTLLVAMVGAIILTHRKRTDTLRQNVSQQIDRPVADVLEIVKVESGKGVL